MPAIIMCRHMGDEQKMRERLDEAEKIAMNDNGEVHRLIEPAPGLTTWYQHVSDMFEALELRPYYDIEMVVGSSWDIAATVDECTKRLARLPACVRHISFIEEGAVGPFDQQTLEFVRAMITAQRSGQVRNGYFQTRSISGRSGNSQISENVAADIRDALSEATLSIRAIAEKFSVNRRTVMRIRDALNAKASALPSSEMENHLSNDATSLVWAIQQPQAGPEQTHTHRTN